MKIWAFVIQKVKNFYRGFPDLKTLETSQSTFQLADEETDTSKKKKRIDLPKMAPGR